MFDSLLSDRETWALHSRVIVFAFRLWKSHFNAELAKCTQPAEARPKTPVRVFKKVPFNARWFIHVSVCAWTEMSLIVTAADKDWIKYVSEQN